MTDFKNIRAFAFDVDGVLTDGGILCTESGELLRIFDAKDAILLRMAALKGYGLAIITGARSQCIVERMLMCGVKREDVYLRSTLKARDLQDYCKRNGYALDEVLFMGDDLPDIGALQAAGMGICPSDAVPEAKQASDLISPYPGGKGCVRDAMEKVLKARGDWNFDGEAYEKRF